MYDLHYEMKDRVINQPIILPAKKEIKYCEAADRSDAYAARRKKIRLICDDTMGASLSDHTD